MSIGNVVEGVLAPKLSEGTSIPIPAGEAERCAMIVQGILHGVSIKAVPQSDGRLLLQASLQGGGKAGECELRWENNGIHLGSVSGCFSTIRGFDEGVPGAIAKALKIVRG